MIAELTKVYRVDGRQVKFGCYRRSSRYLFRQVWTKLCANAVISAREKVCGSVPAALRAKIKHVCADLGSPLTTMPSSTGCVMVAEMMVFLLARQVEVAANGADTAGRAQQGFQRLLGDVRIGFRHQVQRRDAEVDLQGPPIDQLACSMPPLHRSPPPPISSPESRTSRRPELAYAAKDKLRELAGTAGIVPDDRDVASVGQLADQAIRQRAVETFGRAWR